MNDGRIHHRGHRDHRGKQEKELVDICRACRKQLVVNIDPLQNYILFFLRVLCALRGEKCLLPLA